MTKRIDSNQVAPNGVKAVGGVHGYVMQSGHNCAYCRDMHTRHLIKKGVKIEKLAQVQAWA
jgi:Carboxymuconolactone decarboxylase family